jgi:hypothetical protein
VGGLYKYHQSGQSTTAGSKQAAPAEGTLLVDPAQADGTQVTHQVVDPNGSSTDTTYRFGGDGMFIARRIMHNRAGGQAIDFTCTFSPQLPAPPWPPVVGKAFEGDANCDGFTVHVSGRTTGTRTVSLDGVSVQTYVVESTIDTTGQLQSHGSEVDWFAPSLRLPVHSETHQKGSYGMFSFSSDLTSDLESARPS